MTRRAWCAHEILSGPAAKTLVIPSRDAISFDGMRGAFSRSLNSWPVARNARECAVEQFTARGNRARASSAAALLNVMYIPRVPVLADCPINSRVVVLPVPAPAISASSCPLANTSRAATCSSFGFINTLPPLSRVKSVTQVTQQLRLKHSFARRVAARRAPHLLREFGGDCPGRAVARAAVEHLVEVRRYCAR